MYTWYISIAQLLLVYETKSMFLKKDNWRYSKGIKWNIKNYGIYKFIEQIKQKKIQKGKMKLKNNICFTLNIKLTYFLNKLKNNLKNLKKD